MLSRVVQLCDQWEVLRVGYGNSNNGFQGIRVMGFVRNGLVANGGGSRVVCLVMVVINGKCVAGSFI